MLKCSVVQDLLPLYVSGMGSADTRELVEEHLQDCEECQGKLAEIQERVAVQLKLNDEKSTNVFKLMKKKIVRRNVLVGVVASVMALAVAFSGYWFVFHRATPIAYEDGNIWVETSINTSGVIGEGSVQSRDIPWISLELMSISDFYGFNGTSRMIDLDGVETEVIYVYLSGTISTRLWPRDQLQHRIQLAGTAIQNEGTSSSSNTSVAMRPPEDGTITMEWGDFPLPAMEIYYLTVSVDDGSIWSAGNTSLTDEEFYAQRENGVLLWSGTLGE